MIIKRMSDGVYVKAQSPLELAIINGINKEISDRKAADTVLQTNIDLNSEDIDLINNAIDNLQINMATILQGVMEGVKLQDTRSIITTPADYANGMEWNLKLCSVIGISEGGYAAVMGVGSQVDNTSWEFAFTETGNAYFRYGTISHGWYSWSKMWHSLNDGKDSGLDADMLQGIKPGGGAGNIPVMDNTGHVILDDIPDVLTGKDADTIDSMHGQDMVGLIVNLSANAADRYYPIATLPISASGTKDKLLVEIMGGNWESTGLIRDWALFGNRTGFSKVYQRQGGNASARQNMGIVAYSQADGSVKVFVKIKANLYASGLIKAFGAGISGITTPAIPIGALTSTAPTGTLVFDSSTATPDPFDQSVIDANKFAILDKDQTFTGQNTFSNTATFSSNLFAKTFKNAQPIGFYSDTSASQLIMAGSLLISNSYAAGQQALVPANGIYVVGNILSSGNITGAKTYNPVYADYAEFFRKGEDAEPGDVIVKVPGKDEYIKCTAECDPLVIGVVSDEFAHIIGGDDEDIETNLETHHPIGLAGRVYVKVTGRVKEGDLLVTSEVAGHARSTADLEYFGMMGGCVLGKALEDNADGRQKVRMLIMNR